MLAFIIKFCADSLIVIHGLKPPPFFYANAKVV